MPLYEYECRECKRRFELVQKFGDPPPAACPQCGGEVKKLPSAPAFQFKGSGWYATDYAGKGKGEKKEEAGEKPAGEKPAAEGKTAAEETGGEAKKGPSGKGEGEE